MTKDERFLLELYKRGAPTTTDALAHALGYRPHLTQIIIRNLLKCNLIKRDGNTLSLTSRGHDVASSLTP